MKKKSGHIKFNFEIVVNVINLVLQGKKRVDKATTETTKW